MLHCWARAPGTEGEWNDIMLFGPFLLWNSRQMVTSSIEKGKIYNIHLKKIDIVKIEDKSTAAIVAWNWKWQ